MNGSELIGFAITGFVMLVGLIGTVVPGIPGAPLILIAAVGHKFYFREASASYLVLGFLVALTILSLVLDFLGTMFGAKKLGATWRGILGAMIGAIVGLFFSLPGLILGPIVGAVLFEWAGGREWKDSARAGAGAMLGMLLGAVAKAACCVAMIAAFTLSVILNSSRPYWSRSESCGCSAIMLRRCGRQIWSQLFFNHSSCILSRPILSALGLVIAKKARGLNY